MKKKKKSKVSDIVEDVEDLVEDVFELITCNEGDEPMPASVTLTDQASNPIPFTVGLDPGNNAIVVILPSSALPFSNTIHAGLTADVKGANGLNIAPVSEQFTTQPADVAPVVVAEVPDNNATNVLVTAPIRIQFDKPIDPATLTTA